MTLRRTLAWTALFAPVASHASFLSGDALDTAADWMSWFVILFVPLVAIAIFLFIHVLPEKIAETRHHPHKDSIKVLCILSLFFGGMLWPFAWLWAYTRPVGYRAIYGTDKHEDYYLEQGELALEGKLPSEEVAHLRDELAAMDAKGPLPPKLRGLAERLGVERAKPAPAALPIRAALPAEHAAGGTR